MTAWSHDNLGRTLTEARNIGTFLDQTRYTYYFNGMVNILSHIRSRARLPMLILTLQCPRCWPSECGREWNYNLCSSPVDLGDRRAQKAICTAPTSNLADTYNSNLYLLTLTATQVSPSNTVLSKTYDFHIGTGDNGNLMKGDRWLGRPWIKPSLLGSGDYHYGGMNRVSTAQTLRTDCIAGEWWHTRFGRVVHHRSVKKSCLRFYSHCGRFRRHTKFSVNVMNQLGAAVYDSRLRNPEYRHQPQLRCGGSDAIQREACCLRRRRATSAEGSGSSTGEGPERTPC